jgi:aspartate racemase
MDKRFKCKIPIATLFQSPTIELLARRLTDENWAPAWTSLVPLQSQGSKPPLFLVHGWGGDVFVFLDLARLLPPDQPIYGIQAVGLDGKSPRHICIEEMAAHYVKEIVSFQPDGPIYLAGFSMGGVIAYEMARQLHRLGRRVAMLALLDSGPTGKTPWVFYGLAMTVYIPERCWVHVRRWWRLPFRERLNYIRGRWTAFRYWMVRNRSRPPLITAAPQQTRERLEASLGTDYYRAVAHAYQLRPYPGAVDIFVSDESNPAWRLYWRHLVRGGVSFHRVSGGHLQIVLSPDYMPEMAKSLTTVLLRAQEKEARVVSSRDEHSHANLVS